MPLNQTSAVERVRATLEEEINNGVRPPGEPLVEAELMALFDVSRTPVRTAILQLASHGLVTINPRSGTYVARMSPQELLSMLEALAEIEAATAKLAAKRMSFEDRQRLKKLHNDSEAIAMAENLASYELYNAEWHAIIYAGSLNSYLTKQILDIRRRTKVYRRSIFQEPERIKTSYEQHGKISEAIVSGNADAAYRHMLEHIAGSTQDFLQLLSRIPTFDVQEIRENMPASRRK